MKRLDDEKLDEFDEEFGEAVATLTANKEAFKKVTEAWAKLDVQGFQAELKKLKIERFCVPICRWICLKKCVIFCRKVCTSIETPLPSVRGHVLSDIEEMRRFGEITAKLIRDKKTLESLMEAYEKEDVERFQKILKERELTRFCTQICYGICSIRCKRACRILCLRPYITHVGFIPTTQINSEGYASGPSEPPGSTPPPTSCLGDHPFGNWGDPKYGVTNIRGTFNMPNADKYKVEWAPDPVNGPWAPIMPPIEEWDWSKPWHPKITRSPSGLPDPGWYAVADMIDDHYLTNWDTRQATTTTGKFYLRLTVKNPTGASIQSPIVPVRVDNENPSIPQLDLFIKKPDGTEKPVKCGGIKKGDGTLLIKFICTDENFRQFTLTAEGGCGINVAIIDETTGKEAGRCYGGDINDKGETALRVVEWNPWKDPNIVPCCYNVVLRIWDRAILNNFFYVGHGNSDNEAVQIGLGQ